MNGFNMYHHMFFTSRCGTQRNIKIQIKKYLNLNLEIFSPQDVTPRVQDSFATVCPHQYWHLWKEKRYIANIANNTNIGIDHANDADENYLQNPETNYDEYENRHQYQHHKTNIGT